MRLSSPITVVMLATLAIVLSACDPETPDSTSGPAVVPDAAADEPVAEDAASASLDMLGAEPLPAAEADLAVVSVPADPALDDEPTLIASTESDDESFSSTKFSGPVRPSREVALNPALDGILLDVLVEESEAVEKDDVLAQMDDAMQQLMVNTSSLRTQEALAQKDAKDEAFEKGGMASAVEVRQAKLAHQIAEAEQAIQELRLKQYKVKAPFKGRIVLIEAVAGATLTLRDPILQMVQVDPLEARLDLPADVRAPLQVGRQYRLVPDDETRQMLADRGEPTELVGTLKTMAPGNDYASETVHCVFTINNPGGELHYGFGVRLIWPQ